jgi:hypothetical protein
VPAPRCPADGGHKSENVGSDGEWSYQYCGKRGADVTFDGWVIPIGGEAGGRLLDEMGSVLRELLEWAYPKRSESQDGEAI